MKKVLLTVFVLFVCVSLTSAQKFATKGTLEFGGSVTFTSSTAVWNGDAASESSTELGFIPYAGYFIMDGFELGVRPMYMSSKGAGDDDAFNQYAFFLAPSFNIVTSGAIYPYVEGLVGYTGYSQGDSKGSGLSFGAGGGVKVLAGKSGLLNLGLYYLMIDTSPDGLPDSAKRFGENRLQFMAGFSIFLGK